MTKQAASPPTSDKGTSVAPPPPPAWRHLLWPLAFLMVAVLFILLPVTQGTKQVTLNYSQFLSDVSAHKVKTVTIATSGSATGKLSDGSDYTTAIPPQAGQSFLDQLQKDGVQITAETSGTSFGSEVLSWLILLLRSSSSASCGGACPRELPVGSKERSESADPRPRYSTRSVRRRSSPTWPGTKGPRSRSARSSISSNTPSAMPEPAPWPPGAS